MAAIFNLALKDLKLLVFDKMGIFWFLVFPLIFALFFGTLMGGEKNSTSKMKLAIVDGDQSPESRRFIEQLQKSEALAVTPMDRAQAESEVRHGNQTAFIVIPQGFEKNGSFFGGNQTALEEGLDPSRRAEAGYLEGILMEALFQGMTERFSDPARSKADIQEARKEVEKAGNAQQKQLLLGFFNDLDKFLGQADFGSFKDEKGQSRAFAKPQIKKIDITADESGKPCSGYEITFPAALIWGLYGCVMTFAISLVTERTRGTMLRLRTTPMTWTQILAGKGLACFIACFAITALLLTIGAVFFGVRIMQPVGLLLALTISSLGFTGMMLFVSTLGKTERAVAGASSGIFMPLAMLGGGMIPLIAMPDWLQKAASISPFKWGILAFEGSIWRDFSWGDYLLPSVMLLLFGGVGFVVGAYWLTKSEMS
jgi:ABC-2 type transport system permease protein